MFSTEQQLQDSIWMLFISQTKGYMNSPKYGVASTMCEDLKTNFMKKYLKIGKNVFAKM